jgi:hypothetical protein
MGAADMGGSKRMQMDQRRIKQHGLEATMLYTMKEIDRYPSQQPIL